VVENEEGVIWTAGCRIKGCLEGSPVMVMILGLAVFGLFVFSILSSYLSERRRS